MHAIRIMMIMMTRLYLLTGTVCEFLGSLSGGEVANTISGGILVVDAFDEAHYVICMFATMTGAFIWLAVATLYSLPVSTTHSLIGALVGVGVASQGVSGVQWTGVLKIGTQNVCRTRTFCPRLLVRLALTAVDLYFSLCICVCVCVLFSLQHIPG